MKLINDTLAEMESLCNNNNFNWKINLKNPKEIRHSLSELPFNKSHTEILSSSSPSIEKIIATFNDL